MGQKFAIVREERDARQVHNKPVGTVIIDDDGAGGVMYLNHLTHKFKLLADGPRVRRSLSGQIYLEEGKGGV